MSPRARATRSQARILHLKQSTSNGPPQQPEGDHASKHKASHAKAAHKAAPHNPLLSGSHGHTRGRRAVGPVTASDCPQPEAHPCATRCAPGVRAPPGPAGHAPPTPDRSPIGASAPSAPAYVGAQWHTSPLIRKSPQKWQTPRHTRPPPPSPTLAASLAQRALHQPQRPPGALCPAAPPPAATPSSAPSSAPPVHAHMAQAHESQAATTRTPSARDAPQSTPSRAAPGKVANSTKWQRKVPTCRSSRRALGSGTRCGLPVELAPVSRGLSLGPGRLLLGRHLSLLLRSPLAEAGRWAARHG